MKLQPGTKLRQYEILEAIGAGGMGEVYRARDNNLDRDVAIKVLPPSMAENPLHLARLEREAKAIAALSHPNILAVYDFAAEGDTAFLVTELLEGETLGERLAKGPLPARKVTEMGRQIARGLAAAHDKGIVHRDLKPDNLFLTADGRVKILDFGLASDAGTAATDGDQIEATVTDLTMPGTVLGTVHYMSPEQVRGKPTDNRSDLFSFGIVLYEMIGGARPFQRETQPETMTAILKEEPADLTAVSPDTPPALAAIIRRCLEKEAGERFHSAHDLAFSLESLSGSTVSTGTAAAISGVASPRRLPGAAMMAALVVLGLVIGAAAVFLLRPEPAPSEVPTFARLSARRGVVTNARFSGGDGAMIYSASWEGQPLQLFPASTDSRTSDPLNLPNADLLSVASTGELALSLDRRYPVGWEAIGTLAIAQPGGSAPRPILENVLVADWAPDGRTLAVAHEVDGVVQLEYPIGTVLYKSPGWISVLRVNPDGERILFTECPERGDNFGRVKIIDRQGQITEISNIAGSWGAVWTPDGIGIRFSSGHDLFQVYPGQERQLIYSSPEIFHLFDISPTGQMLMASANIRREMIVRTPGAAEESNLTWLDWSTPSDLSADGGLILFEEGNQNGPGGYAIYLRRTDGSPPVLLDFGSELALSPDESRIAMIKRPFRDDAELMLLPTGPGEPVTVETGDLTVMKAPCTWLPGSGKGDLGRLVFLGRHEGQSPRLYFVELGKGSAPQAITPADLPLAPRGNIASADGRHVIVTPAEGTAVVFDLNGKGPTPLEGNRARRFASEVRPGWSALLRPGIGHHPGAHYPD